ncbi:MAG: HAMP domain-containing histidine kinase, partial [Paramuribaculum sp.]|nr:HAMP domain-containing histidine kinase [Paramuribaculum sp.]
YKEAMPLLKPYLDDNTAPVKTFNHHKFYRMLEEAAEATGDSTTLLATARQRNKMLEQLLKSKSEERYRELSVLYEVDKLKSARNDAEIEARESIISSHKTRLVITIAALAILLVITIALARLYRHAKALSRNLRESNTRLEAQRDSLTTTQHDLIEAQGRARKAERVRTDFINNMSQAVRDPLEAIAGYTQLIADNIDDSKRHYLQTYVNIVTLNTELLQTLINDVLDLSEADSDRLNITRRPVRIEEVCHTAMECVRHRLAPDVTLSFDPGNCRSDLIVDTDARRVEQVIVNLLQNATKFTAEGSIILSTHIDSDGSTLSMTVTDTGSGVPTGMEAKIFERYEKGRPSSEGWGLGLCISRQIARLLGGDVVLDQSYTKGARFIFTIPLT